jgi:cell division protein ZapA
MEERGVVQVDIFGSTYTIKKGEEDSDYIQRVAQYVDQKMREINDRLPVASVSKVAVLTSLNLADELFKERESGPRGSKTSLASLAKSTARLEKALADVEK